MTHRATVDMPVSAADLDQMHALYCDGGQKHTKAPHVVYAEALCPHSDCRQSLHAIDFRLEAHGRAIHDPLVRSWWADTGFSGRCPSCGGWIHFTIRAKRAITADEAAALPQLPDDWADKATIIG